MTDYVAILVQNGNPRSLENEKFTRKRIPVIGDVQRSLENKMSTRKRMNET